MLTEAELDALMEMLGRASLEQLDAVRARLRRDSELDPPMCYAANLDPSTNDISGAAKILCFEGERPG